MMLATTSRQRKCYTDHVRGPTGTTTTLALAISLIVVLAARPSMVSSFCPTRTNCHLAFRQQQGLPQCRLETRQYGLFGNRQQQRYTAEASALSSTKTFNNNNTDSSSSSSSSDFENYSINNTSSTSLLLERPPLDGDHDKDHDDMVDVPSSKVVLKTRPLKNGKKGAAAAASVAEHSSATTSGDISNGDSEDGSNSSSSPYQVPHYFREGPNSPGIGGEGGVTYDVNSLKRNLLQETVRAYKMELLALLQSPSATENVIAEKLGALVQASPVRTTTDSNLLEGVDWTLCYQSKFTTVSQLKRPPPALIQRNSQKYSLKRQEEIMTPSMRRVAGKEFSMTRCRRRSFHLEALPDDQDPHVIDYESYWGGLIKIQKTYAIKALTRTSLNLRLQSSKRWVLGRLRSQPLTAGGRQGRAARNAASSPIAANLPTDMTIIYSDNNLCIIADPEQRTYQVYTQDDTWQKGTQFSRQIKFMFSALWYRLTHMGWASRQRSAARLLRELQTHQDLLDEESRLIVWQLGAGDDDEEAWESRKDPFVHLSADDRQRLLKAMSISQVRQAGDQYATSQSRAELLRMPWRRRRTDFRKPKAPRRQTNFRRPQEP